MALGARVARARPGVAPGQDGERWPAATCGVRVTRKERATLTPGIETATGGPASEEEEPR
jgi:hypothetical protein